MKEAIAQLFRTEAGSNTRARASYVAAHTAAVWNIVQAKLPLDPAKLVDIFWEVKAKWVESIPTDATNGKMCGATDPANAISSGTFSMSSATGFVACTAAVAPCCNQQEGSCGADVESCTCDSCVDFTNGWGHTDARAQDVSPALVSELETTLQKAVAENNKRLESLKLQVRCWFCTMDSVTPTWSPARLTMNSVTYHVQESKAGEVTR
jgi:hypothetical protein